MSKHIDRTKLQAMATDLAKDIKTEADLSSLSAELLKLTVETALNEERDDHLGYAKNDPAGNHSGNSRNGHTEKTLKSRHGAVSIKTPRDRNATFEPQLDEYAVHRIFMDATYGRKRTLRRVGFWKRQVRVYDRACWASRNREVDPNLTQYDGAT